MRARFAALVGVIAFAVAILVVAGGCEAIVGGGVGGSVQCQVTQGADAADLCPKGQSCIGGTCKPTPLCAVANCSPRDSGFDAPRDTGTDRDATTPDVIADTFVADTSPKDAAEASSKSPLGAPCSLNSACQTGICGTSLLLTSYVATPEGASVCTKACCTSADCDDPVKRNYVCYPSLGGNYCVDPMWIGHPATVGTGLPGSGCTTGAVCRSGSCSGGKCQDACCLDSNCGSGTVCQYSVLDGTASFNCAPPSGSTQQGDVCATQSSCQSHACVCNATYHGYCIGADCLGACCQDSDCSDPAGIGTTSCNWNELTDPDGGIVELRGCSPAIQPGGGAMGTTCAANADCASNLCYAKRCTAACCASTNCPAGWACGYASFTFSPDTLDLQVCVPTP